MKKLVLSLCLAIACLIPNHLKAAEFPFEKTVTFIVPNAPGGAADILMRILADYFQKEFGITCNVVNKPGGGTAVGINEMLRARPDGYTYVTPGDSGLSVTPLISNVGFTLDNIKPMTVLGRLYVTFATRLDSGIDTWDKAISMAHNDPNSFVYATHSGISNQRLFMTYLMKRFHDSKPVRHTAYGSGGEVSTALLGGHVKGGFQTISNQLPYVKSGDLQVIAIGAPERDPLLPNTPTFIEIYKDQLKDGDADILGLSGWIGLVTNAKVSDEKADIMMSYLKKALEDPEIIEKMAKIGMTPGYVSREQMAKEIELKTNLAKQVLEGRKSLD